MPSTKIAVPCSGDCPIRGELEVLYSKIDENALDPIISEIISTSIRNFPTFKTKKERNLAFSALFDFCVNLRYISGLKKGDLFKSGIVCEDKVVFPFIKMCPICSAKKKQVVFLEKGSNKPESATIGKIGEATLAKILDQYFQYTGTKFRAFLIKDTAEKKVDLILTDSKVVCVGEIKAKPLVSYPLYLQVNHLKGTQHELVDVKVEDVTNTNLLIPHIEKTLQLGKPTEKDWPFSGALKLVQNKENVATIISAWNKIFQEYSKDTGGKTTWVRFLAFGGGAYNGQNIDDSKNRPGLDRTDDIKKGTYQVIRYGANYSAKCKESQVKSVLVGNIYAETHRDYFDDILGVKWTLDGKKYFNLFDAIIGLTDNKFNDEYLKEKMDK